MFAMPLWNHPLPLVQWGVVLSAALAGAATDVRFGRIPNALTLSALCAGLVCALGLAGIRGGIEALAGCALLALPFVVLFVFAGGGAGDAKLMGAVGAWLGLANGLVALVAVVVTGALFGLGLAVAKGALRSELSRLPLIGWLAVSKTPTQRSESLAMPYGTAILGGLVVAAFGVFLWRAQQ